MSASQDSRVIQAVALTDYFHHAVNETAQRRQLGADEATLHYLTLLLCQYARSDRVFDYAEQRLQVRPLALLYGEALRAGSQRERRLWLQRLGDLALFVGGLFAGRLSRRFQDLDYCVAMGGNAYGCLQQTTTRRADQAQAKVFGELADGFDQFVEVVAVVTRHKARGTRDEDRGVSLDLDPLPSHLAPH